MKKRLLDELVERIKDTVALGEVPLPLYAIEKDYHVLDAIRLLTTAPSNAHFRLVFCGGTCLSKAYGILDRMSEDVDFKIVPTVAALSMSKGRLRDELSTYVRSLMAVLDNGGFTDDSIARRSRDNNTYTALDLSFDSPFPPLASMRSHLLIELNCTTLAAGTERLGVGALLDKLTSGTYVAPFNVECVSLQEAAAEKLISFPRRLALHLSKSEQPEVSLQDKAKWDTALVRHLYDIHQIVLKRPDVVADPAGMGKIVGAVISKDAEDFKNQHQSFAGNAVSELNAAIAFAKTSDVLKRQYDIFVSDMVYADEAGRPSFGEALQVFENTLRQALAFVQIPAAQPPARSSNTVPATPVRRPRGPSQDGPLTR